MSQHLWSGRFDAAPDPAAFDFGVSFPFDRRLFEDDVTGSLAWADALVAAGALSQRGRRARFATGLTAILEQGRRDPAVGHRRRRGRAQLRRAAARRAHRRRRPPPAHRPLAQRAGVARPPAVSAPADSAAAGRSSARSSRRSPIRPSAAGTALMPSYTHMRRAMPVLVGALSAEPRRRAPPRSSIVSRSPRDEADAMPLGSGAIAGTGYAVDVDALAARLGFSRVVANSIDASSDRDFVAELSLRLRAGDGASEPARRRLHPVHERGVRVLRARRPVGDRQQHDAAEEEPGSARARARKSRPRHRPSHRVAGDDEGAADRLQQGSAGGQRAGVRRGRHTRVSAPTPRAR